MPTAASLDGLADTSSATAYTGAGSITPTADRLLMATVMSCRTDTTPGDVPSSITGYGATWTRVGTLQAVREGGTQYRKITLWIADSGASPSSATFTVNFSSAQAGCIAHVVEWSADTERTTPIVQSVSDSSSSGSTPQLTFASGITSGNATYGSVLLGNDEAITPNNGETELDERSISGPTTDVQTQYKATGTSTMDWDITSVQNWGAFAVEVAAASSPDATVTPDAVAASVSLPAAAPQTDYTVTPDAVATSVSFPPLQVALSNTVVPATVAVVVSLPAASPTNPDATATPDQIATTIELPSATPSTDVLIVPDPVAAVVTFPGATGSGERTVTPAAIGVTVAVPRPQAGREIAVSLSGLATVAWHTDTAAVGWEATTMTAGWTVDGDADVGWRNHGPAEVD